LPPVDKSALSLTPLSVSPRTVVSADHLELQSQFQETVLNTLCEAEDFHELVITDLPPDWADFLWKLEGVIPKVRKVRNPYSPDIGYLRLRAPRFSDNWVGQWPSHEIFRAAATGFINAA
jgi:hypothetical protein